MAPDITRRGTLRAITISGTIALAGCSGVFGGEDPDIVVFNKTDGEVTADVTLVDDAGEELLSETATIASEEAFEHDDVLPDSGDHTLSVAVEDGPSGEETADVSDVASMQARIEDGDIQFDTF